HFAAQSPERSFFFPLFLSAEKEKEVIGGAVGKSLSTNQDPTKRTIRESPLRPTGVLPQQEKEKTNQQRCRHETSALTFVHPCNIML
ncbi:MAG: hypothetical protein KIG76_06360, partial [Eubacteriales bacterium]|nr:hypothetical protein [Candidatus Colimorpha enterica]